MVKKLILVFSLFAGICCCVQAQTKPAEIQKLFDSRNYAEAMTQAKSALEALKKDDPGAHVAELWVLYANSMNRLHLAAEYDAMFEFMAEKFPKNPYFLMELKRTLPYNTNGVMVNQKFRRGYMRGNHTGYVYADERDRVRNLQLLTAALPEALKWEDNSLKQEFFLSLAYWLKRGREGVCIWKMLNLTDISVLPDYRKGTDYTAASRPPVKEDGTPVYYTDPGNWEAAKNDGERLRYAYARAMEAGSIHAKKYLADWLQRQFDFGGISNNIRAEYLAGDSYLEYLYNLKDNETIAELADGIRKITLPDDQNYIRMYQETESWLELGRIYKNRAQFERAAEYYRKSSRPDLAERITNDCGSLLNDMHVFARTGNPVKVACAYRNAESLRIQIRKADAKKAVEKMREHYRTGKDRTYNAYQLRDSNEKQVSPWLDCIGETLKDYTVKLSPRPHHWENWINLELPVTEPGAYLVRFTAGKSKYWTEALIWISPEVMSHRTLSASEQRIILTDGDGKPQAGRKIRYETYYTRYAQTPEEIASWGKKTKIELSTAEYTLDSNGSAIIPWSPTSKKNIIFVQDPVTLTWIPTGRHFYHDRNRQDEYTRDFIITDRPVYKPGDTVRFTVYPRISRYKEPDHAGPAVQRCGNIRSTFTAYSPRSEKAWKKEIAFHPETGSFTGEFKLPEDAMLGAWSISGDNGRLFFRVEEYKKTEYEMNITLPSKPVKLGDKIEITLEGKYYFGAPMADAEVKYTVRRSESAKVYPFFGFFDWLYGPGYLIRSAVPEDMTRRHMTFGEETVLQSSGKLDSDGKLVISVDTAEALKKYGSADSRYTVTAEVADSTGRVIQTSGSVLAAARPFYVWLRTDCGFGRTGYPFTVTAKALTGDSKEVKGKGILKIYRRALNRQGVPERTGEPVKTAEFVPGSGKGPSFTMNEPGVYELSATVTTPEGISETGTGVFYVTGEKLSGDLFSQNDFELTLDKSEYKVGDTVRVLVTTKTPNRTIYFFRRPERKTDMECVTIKGYSHIFELKLDSGDQPNTFVALYSVSGGESYTIRKQLPVPPESKMLQVKVDIPAEKVKPKEIVPLKIKVTGLDGKPVSGAVTAAVYDKALEAVAASNIPAINAFFWNWKRYYEPVQTTNIQIATNITRSYGFRYISMADLMEIYGFGYYGEYGGGKGMPQVAASPVADMASIDSAAPRIVKKSGMRMKAYSMWKNESAAGLTEANSGAESASSAVTVRSDFKDTAFWLGTKEVKDGVLTVDVPIPDNLTTWKVRVWSLTPDTKVGEGSAEIVVSKDLIARLELPRFLIQGDTVQAVANIHNYTEKDLTVKLNLTAENPAVVSAENTERTVTVPAGKHVSANFPLTAKATGESKFILRAVSGKEADALELKMPILVKGIDKQVNAAGRLDKDKRTVTIPLSVPEQIRKGSSFVTLNLAPGAAKAMVELLPYLADKDDRDVFGVVSRFVPALAAKWALDKMNVKFEDLKLAPGSRDNLYAEYMQHYIFSRYREGTEPSFNPAVFRKVTSDSLQMILGMVNSDGGWGWFSGHREVSWPDTTSFVLDSLLAAEKAGEKIPADVKKNAIDWLRNHAQKRIKEIKDKRSGISNTDAFVVSVLKSAGQPCDELSKILYSKREDLAPYGLSKLAFAFDKGSEERNMLKRNLTQYLKQDDSYAYLDIPGQYCFFWYGNENMTNAAYMKLLLADDPKDPAAVKLANYLVTNIRNSPWRNSTRTLGEVVRALAEYIVASGENRIDLTAKVKLDGKPLKTFRIDTKNMWQSEFTAASALPSGEHKLEIELEGEGVLYFNSMLNYFTLEDKIEPAGLEMKIRRNYYKLVEDKDATSIAAGVRGSLQTAKVLKYKRIPLKDGDKIQVGDLVEVELVSTAKNDYDYVVFADSMPAGFEYVKPVSGYVWNWAAPIYCEYRERGAKFYLRNMARGDSNVVYQIRAQLPGTFTSLPATGKGVYAPELKCNSSQMQFVIGR